MDSLGISALVLLAVAWSAALAAAFAVRRARRRSWPVALRRLPRTPGPRYPVILLHGLLGFDEVEVGSQRHAYFRGVPERLHRLGATVHRPRVARTAGVETRARQLMQRIDDLGAKRVNLVAHSMGGLDARYALTHLGLAPRVACLVTVATPHRGTPLADLGTSLAAGLGLRRVLRRAGVDVEAFEDVTTRRTEELNRLTPDAPEVFYGCVVATADAKRMHPLLRPSHRYLASRVGANDGVVPLASQVWGMVLAQIEADHWAQIGWSRSFDAAAFFEELLRELRELGF